MEVARTAGARHGGAALKIGIVSDLHCNLQGLDLALEAMGEVKATLDRDASSAGDVPMAEVKR